MGGDEVGGKKVEWARVGGEREIIATTARVGEESKTGIAWSRRRIKRK
jgi:hypothetical protein